MYNRNWSWMSFFSRDNHTNKYSHQTPTLTWHTIYTRRGFNIVTLSDCLCFQNQRGCFWMVMWSSLVNSFLKSIRMATSFYSRDIYYQSSVEFGIIAPKRFWAYLMKVITETLPVH